MNLDYDGTTSLRLEIKKRLNKTSHTTQADYIADGCEALGFKKRLRSNGGSPAENVAILKWLLENKTATRNKAQNKAQASLPQITGAIAPKPIEPPTHKTRNKVKRDARYSAFTRISFNVTGNTQRQHISLEPEYMKALELIAPDNRLKWLADTVADYIAKNGIESTTRIVKASIVNALIERVKK
jgi:hypothetical protein